jgi:hypothetical protein
MSTFSRRELLAKAGLAGLAIAVNPQGRAEETNVSEHDYIDKQLGGAWGADERLYRVAPGSRPGRAWDTSSR